MEFGILTIGYARNEMLFVNIVTGDLRGLPQDQDLSVLSFSLILSASVRIFYIWSSSSGCTFRRQLTKGCPQLTCKQIKLSSAFSVSEREIPE